MSYDDRFRNSGRGENLRSRVNTENARAQARNNRKRKFTILLVVEIVAILVVGIIAFLFFYLKSKYDVMRTQDPGMSFAPQDVNRNTDANVDFDEIDKKYLMVMVYGVDARNNSDLLKDANADTDIIVCLNRETYEVKLVSVLRDSFLSTTKGKYKKLTDIYAAYGVKESMETINKNFDLNINQYVTVNWKSVVKAIEILGGIDIDVTKKEIEQINNFGVEVAKVTGYKFKELKASDGGHLNGVQAVAYARIRNVTVDGEGHDIARASRQRKVIKAMLDVCKHTDIGTLKDLLDEVLPGMATSISFSEAVDLLMDVKKYNITDNTMMPFKYVDQSNLRTAYVYYDTLESNVKQLHEFLFGSTGYVPSGTVKNISEYINEYRRENP